jgi:hypothetical protein
MYVKASQSDPDFQNELERSIELERTNSMSSNTTKGRGFYFKVKQIFKDWVTSPYFILHFCRIGMIVYIVIFRSLISEVLFIW